MDISNIDASVWQYLFAFIEHNKIFTLILICIAAVFWLLIKKIIAFPYNFFTGKINNTKMMLAEWQKDICSFRTKAINLLMTMLKICFLIVWPKKSLQLTIFGSTRIIEN